MQGIGHDPLSRLDSGPNILHLSYVKTTLVLEDDVLEAARHLAQAKGKTLGQVISELARKGLSSQPQKAVADEGFPVFAISANAEPITREMVQRALEES
jgi:hypothetical protein